MIAETIRARQDENNWIRCGKCSHKLGRIVGDDKISPTPIIEIKCHSCKSINVWWYVDGECRPIDWRTK